MKVIIGPTRPTLGSPAAFVPNPPSPSTGIQPVSMKNAVMNPHAINAAMFGMIIPDKNVPNRCTATRAPPDLLAAVPRHSRPCSASMPSGRHAHRRARTAPQHDRSPAAPILQCVCTLVQPRHRRALRPATPLQGESGVEPQLGLRPTGPADDRPGPWRAASGGGDTVASLWSWGGLEAGGHVGGGCCWPCLLWPFTESFDVLGDGAELLGRGQLPGVGVAVSWSRPPGRCS